MEKDYNEARLAAVISMAGEEMRSLESIEDPSMFDSGINDDSQNEDFNEYSGEQEAASEDQWTYPGPFAVSCNGSVVKVNPGRVFAGDGLPVNMPEQDLAWAGVPVWIRAKVGATGIFGAHAVDVVITTETTLTPSTSTHVYIWLAYINDGGAVDQWQWNDIYLTLWRHFNGSDDVASVGLQTPVCCPGIHAHAMYYNQFDPALDVCAAGPCVPTDMLTTC